ncbi:MAG: tyrosine--tRNA ligase [Nanoarchaeota archaeon]
MDMDTKIQLIKEFADEIVTEDELRHIFETNDHPIAYDGFEPSGIAPIHFGLLRATNLKNMIKAGVKFKLYLADYFAFVNNKLGGNLDNIRTAGKYFVEVWKACGIDTSKVDIIWAKDIMDGIDYWDKTLKIAREISLERNLRAVTIMGRKQSEKLNVGQLLYPSMQVTDIFYMNVDICQLGMDQRRANMLAREIATKLKWKKPVAAHHHIILGLQGLQKKATEEETLMASKMSKSDSKSCIYMHESYEEIKKKINSAYCPEKQEEGNPLLEYCKYIIFKELKSMKIQRSAKFGGDVEYGNYQELWDDYIKGKLHPADLKNGVADALEKLIKPAREYFEKNKQAKELYEKVKRFTITR